MSATLKWEPTNRKCKVLPDELKYILQGNGNEFPRHFGEYSVGYLEGLRDAKVKGAQELLDAIEKYGDVTVFLEY